MRWAWIWHAEDPLHMAHSAPLPASSVEMKGETIQSYAIFHPILPQGEHDTTNVSIQTQLILIILIRQAQAWEFRWLPQLFKIKNRYRKMQISRLCYRHIPPSSLTSRRKQFPTGNALKCFQNPKYCSRLSKYLPCSTLVKDISRSFPRHPTCRRIFQCVFN